MLRIVEWGRASQTERLSALTRPVVRESAALADSVAHIIDAVRLEGDVAIREFTAKFDCASPGALAVGAEEFDAAEALLTVEEKQAIDLAIDNVRRFHEAQVPTPLRVETVPGVVCERVSHPLNAVGLYVPAGTAALPSAAIMLAVPAKIAGCPRIVLCTPPAKDGNANAAVLVAAARAGVREVYKVGGAQAVAGLAFGTATLPKVDKIFGPGNAWVTEAKSQVASMTGGAAIDMPAGPSEVLVIADEVASPDFVAADLLSQAEHGVDSQVILLTDSRVLAERVRAAVTVQLARLGRRDIAAEALANSVAVVVGDIGTAVDLSNDYAPEHLILQVTGARELLPRIRNAGSVFLGPWSPESAGDYCSGTNHVLPTYGNARAFSGLSVEHFMRQMTVQELSRDGLQSLADAILTLAGLEGLDAHARAVSLRLSGEVPGP